MRNKFTAFLLAATASAAAIAQGAPGTFEVRRSVSQTERERLWQSTSVQGSYLEVFLDDAYASVIDRLRVYATPTAGAAVSSKYSPRLRSAFLNSNLRAEFLEGGNRTSLFFDVAGASAMLTLWDFSLSGGAIEAYEEFQNASVNGASATLALVRSSTGNPKVVWKLTWTSAGRQYEFYLAEPSGPTRNAAQIVSLAQELVAN